MKIRPAILSELEKLREVRNLSAQVGCRDAYSTEQLAAWLKRPLPEKMLGLVEKGYVRVAEDQLAVIGYGAIDPASQEVEAVFVLPSYAGRGVGRALLHELELVAMNLHLNYLQLSASLNAVPFYRAAGYVTSTKGVLSLGHSLVLEYESMEKNLGASV